jgi:hypothetical protein
MLFGRPIKVLCFPFNLMAMINLSPWPIKELVIETFMVARFRYLAEKSKGNNIIYLIEETWNLLHPTANKIC